RREVHRRASTRPIITAVGNGGGDTILAFLDRGIWQSNDDDRRQPARRVHLDLDLVGINAKNGGGINFREHLREVGREIFARKGTNRFLLKLRANRRHAVPPHACHLERARGTTSQAGESHEIVRRPIAGSWGPSTSS